MKFDLASRVQRRSRRPIILANIAPTQAQAGDLCRLYLWIVEGWRERVDRIVPEYERSIAELRTDSAATTGSAIDGVAAEIQRLILMLTPDLRDWAVRVEKVHRGKWVSNVLSATNIDLNTILSPTDVDETVEAALNWNTALVRDVSEEVRQRIANAVFAGFQRRAPAAEIAKELREATTLARARSLRVASDQVVKLGAQLNRGRRLQAGIGHYKWRHSAKRHPRLHHLARDGKIFENDDPRIPADDRAGIPPFCGCTEQAVLVFDD